MLRYHHCAAAAALVIVVIASACTKSADSSAAGDSVGKTSASLASNEPAMGDTNSMKGMAGMKGMPDSAMSGLGGEMQTHMATMKSASGEAMKSLLPVHRQMVANMIAKMNGEMRDMKMASDTEWSATVDSLRKDLVRMPELGSAELTAMMPGHTARVTRLAEMHQKMMRSMGSK